MVIVICLFLGCFVGLAGFLSYRHLKKEYEEIGMREGEL